MHHLSLSVRHRDTIGRLCVVFHKGIRTGKNQINGERARLL